MANLTEKYIETYIVETYGALKHNKKAFKQACVKTAKQAQCNPMQIFHFIIENVDYNGFCNSSGFNTSYGRSLKADFGFNYCKIRQQQEGK
jgi:hypothetical protein